MNETINGNLSPVSKFEGSCAKACLIAVTELFNRLKIQSHIAGKYMKRWKMIMVVFMEQIYGDFVFLSSFNRKY